MVRAVPIREKLFIGGDLNGHVGTTKQGSRRHMGVLVLVAEIRKGRKS